MTDDSALLNQYLNYPGDRRGMIGNLLGPNGFGEMLVAVSVEYDKEINKSRVWLALLNHTPDDGDLEQQADGTFLLPVVE